MQVWPRILLRACHDARNPNIKTCADEVRLKDVERNVHGISRIVQFRLLFVWCAFGAFVEGVCSSAGCRL